MFISGVPRCPQPKQSHESVIPDAGGSVTNGARTPLSSRPAGSFCALRSPSLLEASPSLLEAATECFFHPPPPNAPLYLAHQSSEGLVINFSWLPAASDSLSLPHRWG